MSNVISLRAKEKPAGYDVEDFCSTLKAALESATAALDAEDDTGYLATTFCEKCAAICALVRDGK
jgi:hypothetical protein